MTHRTPTIAIMVDYLVSSYQVGIIRAVERASKAKGVSLLTLAGRALHAPSVGDATQNRIYEFLGSENVDGIILVAGCMSYASGAGALADYCARYRPTPVCSIGVELPNTPSLIISNEQGSRAVVEHLIVHHAAKRIAYIGGPAANREAADRHAGYVAALTCHGLEVDDNLVERGDFYLPGGIAAMREILLRTSNIDAVVAANDYMAIGAMQMLRTHGLRVPDDVLLAGFDDAPFARFALPSLTTVRQPLDSIARTAVDWLLEAAAGKSPPLVAQIDVDIVARQSCGCGLVSNRRVQTLPPEYTRQDTAQALIRHRNTLLQSLHANVGVPPNSLDDWAGRLLDALHAELADNPGRFLTVLHALLEEAQSHPDFVDELAKVVSQLRVEIRRLRPLCEVALELEHVWHGAQIAVGNAATNVQGREKNRSAGRHRCRARRLRAHWDRAQSPDLAPGSPWRAAGGANSPRQYLSVGRGEARPIGAIRDGGPWFAIHARGCGELPGFPVGADRILRLRATLAHRFAAVFRE